MITKYFTKILTRFDPFGAEAKTARLFLSSIPPLQRNTTTSIKNELLTNNTKGNQKPLIKVTFKDKKEFEYDPSALTFKELGALLDRHSRQLSLKESIENQ
ncbi:probable 54S ribosomal protein L44, mitochondrial [Saccharomycodes ludwigii]|uniref:Large ribosomal subunit protein mL53 n=1 Tax=Saccharomycodes ludwigii TaxID=36035 RepID=A0A376B6L2_9ASCO|nr:hypothetical protein SCDLUD_000397 [Saccharomycodes ludwigii]KAH3902806.1 hypothetical protein SCDLUD_000397 [Saccharomycodes ludwigii]SSD59740.1 probable 54S ribosomal protein L44, mitochondrial [Saccharomycodes ludwigii]